MLDAKGTHLRLVFFAFLVMISVLTMLPHSLNDVQRDVPPLLDK